MSEATRRIYDEKREGVNLAYWLEAKSETQLTEHHGVKRS